jgi:fibronectin type 3 domain-containing protein
MRSGIIFASLVSVIILYAHVETSAQQTLPVDYAVQVTANVRKSPPQIQLVWPRGRWDTSYMVSRKLPGDRQWSPLAQLPAGTTSYADNNVVVGRGYEYQIRKSTTRGFTGYGYLYAGIELPMVENRGKLILLVQSTYAQPLNAELSRLTQDLVGDGWQVVQVAVRPDIHVAEVKSVINGIYDSDPGQVKALFIFGHVPVAYSGNIFPDDHVHQGAWPADGYYGDMTGKWKWTDFVVNLRQRNYAANRNYPGDRKFDLSYPPNVDLQVGRVDFWNLPAFQGQDELSLYRRYLDKNHRFRHGQIPVQRRALIADFLPKGFVPTHTDGDGDPVGNSGWRNFSAFFGPGNIRELGVNEYMTVATQESWLWSHGASVSRQFHMTDGIASAAELASRNLNVIFTSFVGGFYGDWNTQDNLLRAAIASGNTLASIYAGLPHWYLQHMALGETIGFGTRLTQMNRRGGLYPPFNDGAGQVHIALMGDPSLRLHPVIPPSNLTANSTRDGVQLTWTASRDRQIHGYHVYRASSGQGPFQRISGSNPIQTTSFQDGARAGSTTYMVRAVKLEESPSGTYFNGSQGIFVTAPTEIGVPASPSNLQARALSGSEVLMTWTDNSNNETGFRIDRAVGNQNFTQLAIVNANAGAFVDRERVPGTSYSYRIAAFNANGTSPLSNTAQATTLPATPGLPEPRVRFVQTDTQTQGTWPGRFGTEGYYVVTKEDVAPHAAPAIWPSDPIIPVYADVQPFDKHTYIWSSDAPITGAGLRSVGLLSAGSQFRPMHGEDHVDIYPLTNDRRALLREPGLNERMASAWYNADRFAIDITINSTPRRVSFYFLDWDRAGRVQTVQVFGRGQLLDTRTVSNFQNGIYYTWEVQGPVRFEFVKVSGPNALMMGMFFDPVGGPADPPPPLPPPSEPPPPPPPQDSTLPGAPSNLAASTVSSSEILVRWSDNSNNESGFRLTRRPVGSRATSIINLPANTTSYTDRNLSPDIEYVYQVYAVNTAGISRPSNIATARTPGGTAGPGVPGVVPAAAQFARMDIRTIGNWPGLHGHQGYLVVGGASSLPASVQVNAAGKSDFVWSRTTQEPRALLTAPGSSQRVAGAWYAPSQFTVEVNLTDGQTHSVALYFLDWDNGGRRQTVDILDASTGTVLDSRTVSGFSQGQYYVWNLRGRIQIRISRADGNNAVLSGLFFNGTPPSTTPPSFSLRVHRQTDSQVRLEVDAPQGARYAVESSDDLLTWTPVVESNEESDFVEIDEPVAEGQRFYRVRELE